MAFIKLSNIFRIIIVRANLPNNLFCSFLEISKIYLFMLVRNSHLSFLRLNMYINMYSEQDPKPQFRNTRSKFFKKKSSVDHSFSEAPTRENTGAFWKKKGNQYYSKGNVNEAIDAYTKAIEINPGESIYFSNRARCYKRLKKLDLALKDAEEACQLDQMNIKAHYICGCILAQKGKDQDSKLSKANNRLKKALRLCSTLKKSQFSDEISIKLFRLKKLQYLKEQERQLKSIDKLVTALNKDKQKNSQMIMHLEKQKKALLKQKEIPDYLLCKITLEVMEDPVTTEAGFTYEKSAIYDHFQRNGHIDPLTRSKTSPQLYPNLALKTAIQNFMQNNPWAFEHTPHESFHQIIF